MNKSSIAICFLLLGVLSSYISDFICWMILDDLECGVFGKICLIWDKAEYLVSHKVISLLLYWIGINGFVGTILWAIEEKILGGILGKSLSGIFNIFGFIFSGLLSIFLISKLGHLLGLYQFFELTYNIIN